MGGGGDFRGEREGRDRMGERNKGRRKERGEGCVSDLFVLVSDRVRVRVSEGEAG